MNQAQKREHWRNTYRSLRGRWCRYRFRSKIHTPTCTYTYISTYNIVQWYNKVSHTHSYNTTLTEAHTHDTQHHPSPIDLHTQHLRAERHAQIQIQTDTHLARFLCNMKLNLHTIPDDNSVERSVMGGGGCAALLWCNVIIDITHTWHIDSTQTWTSHTSPSSSWSLQKNSTNRFLPIDFYQNWSPKTQSSPR